MHYLLRYRLKNLALYITIPSVPLIDNTYSRERADKVSLDQNKHVCKTFQRFVSAITIIEDSVGLGSVPCRTLLKSNFCHFAQSIPAQLKFQLFSITHTVRRPLQPLKKLEIPCVCCRQVAGKLQASCRHAAGQAEIHPLVGQKFKKEIRN